MPTLLKIGAKITGKNYCAINTIKNGTKRLEFLFVIVKKQWLGLNAHFHTEIAMLNAKCVCRWYVLFPVEDVDSTLFVCLLMVVLDVIGRYTCWKAEITIGNTTCFTETTQESTMYLSTREQININH